MNYPLPFFPIQIVFIELIIHPTALLVFQDLPHAQGLRAMPPEDTYRLLSLRDWFHVVLAGGLFTLIVCLSFTYSLNSGASIEEARSLILALLAGMSLAITVGLNGFRTPIVRVMAVCIITGTLLMIQQPWLASLFGLHPLSTFYWGGIAGVTLLAWAVIAVLTKHTLYSYRYPSSV